MPRGGARSGTPGTQYPNRTDIAAQPNLPARAATDQTYGKAADQLNAQRTVPMAPPPGPPMPSPTTSGGPAPQGIPPGAFGAIDRPTERPNEPVTAGAALGAGPGTEAIQGAVQGLQQSNNVSSVLQKAAAATGSAVLQQMAARAQAVGQ